MTAARTFATCVYCKRRSADRSTFVQEPYFPSYGVTYRCADREACAVRRAGRKGTS